MYGFFLNIFIYKQDIKNNILNIPFLNYILRVCFRILLMYVRGLFLLKILQCRRYQKSYYVFQIINQILNKKICYLKLFKIK